MYLLASVHPRVTPVLRSNVEEIYSRLLQMLCIPDITIYVAEPRDAISTALQAMLQCFMCFVRTKAFIGYWLLRLEETGEFRERYIDCLENI